MEKSKLAALLRTFSPDDWLRFRLYVRSPFFNRSAQLIQLTELLEEAFRKNNLPQAASLWQLIYPDRPYVRQEWHRWCHRLHDLAQGYLAYQSWQQEEAIHSASLLRALHERQLNKHFHFNWKKATGQLADRGPLDLLYYQAQYQLAEIAELRFSAHRTRDYDPYLQAAADKFDHFLIAKKLQYLCAIASRNKQQPDAYVPRFATPVLAIAEQLEDIPLIALYRRLYLIFTDTEPATYFTQVHELLQEHETILAKGDQRMIYLSLINYCIERIRYGEQQQYAAILLSLYERALAQEILTEDGSISPWTFKNVIKLGLGLRRFHWVEQFIHQYTPLLAEEQRQEALHFNLADLHYHQQEYDQAQLHLREVEFSDVHYLLHARVMLVKIFYETGAWEALESQLSSFRIFLLRHKKISRDIKKPYLNFVRLTERLLKILPEQREKLRQQIEKTPMLTDRSWLLERVTDNKGAIHRGSVHVHKSKTKGRISTK